MKKIDEKLEYLKQLATDVIVKQYDQIPYPRQMLSFIIALSGVVGFCLAMWYLLGGKA